MAGDNKDYQKPNRVSDPYHLALQRQIESNNKKIDRMHKAIETLCIDFADMARVTTQIMKEQMDFDNRFNNLEHKHEMFKKAVMSHMLETDETAHKGVLNIDIDK